MTKLHFDRVAALVLTLSLLTAMAAKLPQQISGGASAFQGQDIMGGAAMIFKRPPRARDLVGGASMLVVKQQPRPVVKPTEVALNNPPDRRRQRPGPGERPVATPAVTASDQGE